mmetsp:Transcript_17830/g.40768  ORF Transcript_17830/g.40768 Transcript_17830/m.40768 type:complete len:103 (-) Transcript_17830:61-369(-)
MRKSTSPRANRAGSKKKSIPKSSNATPPANNPVPIFALSLIILNVVVCDTNQSKLFVLFFRSELKQIFVGGKWVKVLLSDFHTKIGLWSSVLAQFTIETDPK